jgi:hypothetical protein
MSSTISPLRRLVVAVALTGATALGTVAVAPAALADDTAVVAPATETAPAVSDKAEAPKPPKGPKICTAEDLDAFAVQSAKWTQQADQLTSLADKSQAAADALRAQAKNLRSTAKKIAEELAKGLDKAAKALDKQADELLDKARFGLECTVPGGPRF